MFCHAEDPGQAPTCYPCVGNGIGEKKESGDIRKDRDSGLRPDLLTDMFTHHEITAAIYISVSTTAKNQDTQMAELSQYARSRGWKVQQYRERSTRAGTRPTLGQLMYRVRPRIFDVVLVDSVDCFGRSLAELSENVARLYWENIRFLATSEDFDIDPETEAGRRSFETLTILAKAEQRMISRSVRSGLAKAQRKGTHCGRPEREFPRAKARTLRARGISIRAIAARLGVPASTVADELRR
jgi:putative DNA-invertase from lambdoid prophage Rac